MSNQAHLLEAPVRAAAEAIANARAGRRGAPAVTGILDVLPATLFAEVVEDARVAIDAHLGVMVTPLPRGPLNGLDVAVLGLSLNASSALILVRDRKSGAARAALWAVAAEPAVLGHEEAHALWGAVSGVLRTLPGEAPAIPSTPSSTDQEPRP